MIWMLCVPGLRMVEFPGAAIEFSHGHCWSEVILPESNDLAK